MLMIATFLQYFPPKPTENSGALFMSILEYYGRFFNPQFLVVDFLQ